VRCDRQLAKLTQARERTRPNSEARLPIVESIKLWRGYRKDLAAILAYDPADSTEADR
jgi:hypothetical protein